MFAATLIVLLVSSSLGLLPLGRRKVGFVPDTGHGSERRMGDAPDMCAEEEYAEMTYTFN